MSDLLELLDRRRWVRGEPTRNAIRMDWSRLQLVPRRPWRVLESRSRRNKNSQPIYAGLCRTAKRPTIIVFLSPWRASFLATRPAVLASCRSVREQGGLAGRARMLQCTIP
jgi:hypothetical protein